MTAIGFTLLRFSAIVRPVAVMQSPRRSNASRSRYTDVNGYALHNFRLGFRTEEGLDFSLWLRNAFDQNYFEQLVVTPGNTGLIAGIPADPRTFGATLAVPVSDRNKRPPTWFVGGRLFRRMK